MKLFIALLFFSSLAFAQMDTTITRQDSTLIKWEKLFVENNKTIKKYEEALKSLKEDQIRLETAYQTRYAVLLEMKKKD